MLKKDFYFDLPSGLIAQQPAENRSGGKLMALDKTTGRVTHSNMESLVSFIEPGTLMVFNDTRVRRARVFARCVKNAAEFFDAELLFISPLDTPPDVSDIPESLGARWKVMVKKAKKIKAGMTFVFPDGKKARVVENELFKETEFREIEFEQSIDESWFEKNGHMPLPPYIKRKDQLSDTERYQTVYAKETGSIAAPTAGLHFTREIFERINDARIETARVTLHVGLGTFLPVRAERIENHVMHHEYYCVSEQAARAVNEAKDAGRKILAVGTTTVRTLESAYAKGKGIRAGSGTTNIFIYPGYTFKIVDSLFTNFHTPESTLLMLVCAFAGKENIFAAYTEAVNRHYKFFSYGDAMLIADT